MHERFNAFSKLKSVDALFYHVQMGIAAGFLTGLLLTAFSAPVSGPVIVGAMVGMFALRAGVGINAELTETLDREVVSQHEATPAAFNPAL